MLDNSDILADVWSRSADEDYTLSKQQHFCWILGN